MVDVTGTDRRMKDAFKIDDAQVRGHVDRIVVESVEQTLNGLLVVETQIIERYKRRESSVGESLIEMYPAGVSVRRVEDIVILPKI